MSFFSASISLSRSAAESWIEEGALIWPAVALKLDAPENRGLW